MLKLSGLCTYRCMTYDDCAPTHFDTDMDGCGPARIEYDVGFDLGDGYIEDHHDPHYHAQYELAARLDCFNDMSADWYEDYYDSSDGF